MLQSKRKWKNFYNVWKLLTYNLNKNKFNFDEFNSLIDKNFIVNPFNNNNGIIPRIIIELFNILIKKIPMLKSLVLIFNFIMNNKNFLKAILKQV